MKKSKVKAPVHTPYVQPSANKVKVQCGMLTHVFEGITPAQFITDSQPDFEHTMIAINDGRCDYQKLRSSLQNDSHQLEWKATTAVKLRDLDETQLSEFLSSGYIKL
ncbi:hypothetical protein [Moritella viscosa]|uniref:Uncharacterized protein aq_aa32 n=1 Tax=Moritella viscosa TaxID=80854 RepID=A0A1L0C9R4_9GAMM|nr:hypothetical protein [Moritella viscosa]SGZ17425.1 Uncharacterized protein aq_aa32 [Moritella viscosa]